MEISTMESFVTWESAIVLALIVIFLSIFGNYLSDIWTLLRTNMALCRLPSSPIDDWFHGHAEKLSYDMRMITWLRSLHKYGKIQCWRMGYKYNAVVTHPDIAKIVLNASCDKHVVAFDVIRSYLGDSLLTGAGEKWYRNRRLLTPVFHFKVLQTYTVPMQKCFQQLAEKLDANTKNPVEIFRYVNQTTMQALMKIAFGDTGLTKQETTTLKASIDQVEVLWFKRLATFYHWNDIIYKCTQNGRKFFSLIETIHEIGLSVLNNCRENMKNRKKENGYLSFVDLLLLARDDDNKGLSDKEILNEVHTFLFAGQDTTGSAIPYCLHQLAKHPEYQEKCRDEIISVCGEKGEITWAQISNLTFLTMCIKETLRITGPSPMITRRMDKDVRLDENTVIVKGSTVWIVLESVHHNPSVWNNPDVYNPQRFAAEEADKRHPHAFIPFSSGPRNCIGQAFAMTEIKVALVVFLRKFRFRLEPSKPLEMTFPLLRGTKDGMWFNIEKIE